MTIHYHGTPITPRRELRMMAGKHFCVSFANPRDAEFCLTQGQSVMWDNGAFSFYNSGKSVNWEAYYKWLDPLLGHPHWAVIPDVIDGDVESNKHLIKDWPFPSSLSAPVWHLAEPIDVLLEYADSFEKVCFGSSGEYWKVGSQAWAKRADLAFNELAKRHMKPWVHMLRGMAVAGKRWPFASVDSANVARNFKDKNHCPEAMARVIDAVQCPVKWVPSNKQLEMIV